MATSLNIKRKNIDLPVDVLQKLSLMAVSQGKSLKAYIETILISKADSISINVTENPSPSGDKWFDCQENISTIEEGVRQMHEGKTRLYDIDDIRKRLG